MAWHWKPAIALSVSSASAEGDSNKNKTSTKPSKIETSPGLDGSRVFMNNKDALTVTVDHPKGEWELIPYKGGKVKSTADPSKHVITEQN